MFLCFFKIEELVAKVKVFQAQCNARLALVFKEARTVKAGFAREVESALKHECKNARCVYERGVAASWFAVYLILLYLLRVYCN